MEPPTPPDLLQGQYGLVVVAWNTAPDILLVLLLLKDNIVQYDGPF